MSNNLPKQWIEAAEKEYPYGLETLHPTKLSERARVQLQRAAYIKGLELCRPLVEALENLMVQYKMRLERDFKKIGTTVEYELEMGNLPTYKKAIEALANFPNPNTEDDNWESDLAKQNRVLESQLIIANQEIDRLRGAKK